MKTSRRRNQGPLGGAQPERRVSTRTKRRRALEKISSAKDSTGLSVSGDPAATSKT
jgi:hypothetical protein